MIHRATIIHALFCLGGLITVTADMFLFRLTMLIVLASLHIAWMHIKIKHVSGIARQEGARFGAAYGVNFYRRSTSLHPEAIYQTDLDQYEVGQ